MGAAGADGEVTLAEGREEIGHGLQGADHPVLHGEREPEPEADNEERQGPLNFRGLIPHHPKVPHRHDHSGRAGQQHAGKDVLVVSELAFGGGHPGRVLGTQLQAMVEAERQDGLVCFFNHE